MKDFVIPLAIAVIGLAATGWGALVGARAARFGAEKNAEAVRRQVQDQGAVEHGHWTRQERMTAYESFLGAWDECLRITQTPAEDHASDSAALETLRVAAVRMAERARRIAILGPLDVARAAESLSKTMERDVKIVARLTTEVQEAIADVDGRPIDNDALAEATAEFQRRNRDLTNLVTSYRAQGRDLRELDGHPVLRAALESMQQYRQVSSAARDALTENFERLSAASEQAFPVGAELILSREQHEIDRQAFTRAARTALSTPPPLSTSTETRTETSDTGSRLTRRRNHTH
ncbi:hypothetical protein [Streptomyces sp. L2]|uniref:hypothetical protein n=1 Tax=Streptomyces sp. L2 TaxID=2162665 RepID=UPI001013222B|nr:hypothetical protein [Streptomyces sp. L2]